MASPGIRDLGSGIWDFPVDSAKPTSTTSRGTQPPACSPVDAGKRLVVPQPAFELAADSVGVAGITRQPERASKLQPVLMAVQLPNDLVVADLGTEERHVGVEDARCPAVMDRIRMPIDPSVAGEAYVVVAKQIVSALEQAVRPRGSVAACVGPAGEHLMAQRRGG